MLLFRIVEKSRVEGVEKSFSVFLGYPEGHIPSTVIEEESFRAS